MSKRALMWTIPAVFYALFVWWYTDFGGPLQPDEIAAYRARLIENGLPPEAIARLEPFMTNDTGNQFLMLNVIDMDEDPPDVEGAEPGESADQLMGRYMEHMYAQLLKRASHPVMMGRSVHPALDLVGVERIDGVETWDMGALFRYRSRRTFLDVIAIPETRDRHEFKVAALEKTIAFPVEPILYFGDPRFWLGLVLLAGTALADIAFFGRRR